MGSVSVLIVDDGMPKNGCLSDIVKHAGYKVDSVSTESDTLEKLNMTGYGMLIINKEVSNYNLLKEVKKITPNLPVIIFSSEGTIHDAVEAMQTGASDYIVKPCPPDLVSNIVEKYLKNGTINKNKAESDLKDINFHNGNTKIITQDASLKKILKLSKKIARSDSTVLIQGDSGTGKELLAEYIHAHSGRENKVMVALNCAALPETLAESELFGYEKGAFTGAFKQKKGKFEQANNGTLLLDEIGEMALPLQAKLLRAIQQKKIDRVGGNKPIEINTRIIAITNISLKDAVAKGNFREDLYYRINVIPFKIPKLRDRKNDIPLLVEYFIEKYCNKNRKKKKTIDSKTLEILMSRQWQGNVRELENCIERAVLLSENEFILPNHLLLEDLDINANNDLDLKMGMTVKDMEKKLIVSTLSRVNDNRTKAADILGISIRTLRNKLNQYQETL